MFDHNIDPVLFAIGPFEVRYYGLVFVFGILLSYYFLRKSVKKRNLQLTENDLDLALIYGIIGLVVGARLGSVISEIGFYATNPLDILAVWKGGLAFHGALAGLAIMGWLYVRQKKISFYDVADPVVIPVLLALGFGRIANFINGEFYGIPTDLPWGVKFSDVEGFRHPVQLYEAIKNFLIFGLLWFIRNKNLPAGTLFWLFMSLYGAMRFILEFYKDDVTFLFLGLTWGQVWSLPMVLLGLYALYKSRFKSKLKNSSEESSEKSVAEMEKTK